MEEGYRVSELGVMMTLALHQGCRNPGCLPLAHAWHQKAIFHTMLRISEPASKSTDWYPFTWMLGLYCLLFFNIIKGIFSMSHAAKRSAVVKELMKLPLHPPGLK